MCFVVSSFIFCIADILLFSNVISLISSVIIDWWILSICSVYIELTLVLYVDTNLSTSSIIVLLLSICFFVNVSKLLIYLSKLDKSFDIDKSFDTDKSSCWENEFVLLFEFI